MSCFLLISSTTVCAVIIMFPTLSVVILSLLLLSINLHVKFISSSKISFCSLFYFSLFCFFSLLCFTSCLSVCSLFLLTYFSAIFCTFHTCLVATLFTCFGYVFKLSVPISADSACIPFMFVSLLIGLHLSFLLCLFIPVTWILLITYSLYYMHLL